MELILSSAVLGVDRQRQHGVFNGRAEFLRHYASVLQGTVTVFEQCITLLQINSQARRRLPVILLIGYALFADDLPKRIGIAFNMKGSYPHSCHDKHQQKRNDDEGPTICLHSAAIREVGFLCLSPTAEFLVHSKQFYRGKGAGKLLRNLSIARTIVILGCNRLSLGRIEILQIGLSHWARSLLINHFIHNGNRRLCQNRLAWGNDLKLVFAQLIHGQIVPVMDPFWITLADQEHNRGSVRCRVIRQTLNPVLIDAATFSNRINIRLQRQRHDVSTNAVYH
nr:Uncharacterised protein [Ipomoea batatas]